MENKKTVSNILKLTISNGIILISSLLVGFLLPKIIGVEDYGYYKTFSLYAAYVGVFHFGIEDGIYLKYGGKKYEELDREKFNFYTRFLVLLEFLISLIGICVCLLFLSAPTKWIFLGVACYLFAMNICNYYQMISQITSRFNELTIVNVVRAGITIIGLLVLWYFYHFKNETIYFWMYLILYVGIFLAMVFYYIFSYRDITLKKSAPIEHERFKEIGEFIRTGFPLLVANLCLIFILLIDQQFVNILFKKDNIYPLYAFAYNLINIFTIATNAISTVLYPTLKNTSLDKMKRNYETLIAIILVFIFGCMICYQPLCLFIEWFLPHYEGSLPIFRIIFPGLALSSTVTIIMHNYYKTLGKSTLFFVKALFIIGLSIVANIIAYLIYPSPISISIASIFVLFVWYIITEYYFYRTYHIGWIRNIGYFVLMATIFYTSTTIKSPWISFGVYIGCFILLTIVFYWKIIVRFIKKIRK